MKENEVWNATLDDKYSISVERSAPYQGILTISDGDEVLYQEPVGLMYNAQFGPDMEDVHRWKQTAVGFIDSRK
jgi:hypothetical protein